MSSSESKARVLKDRYRLDRLLGKGGMGEVHAGVDLQLDRPVAVKLIQGHIMKEESAEQRFFVEARACARIDSHHVVSVYDYGVTDDGERFLVLEYVDGRSLRELISSSGRLESGFARDIAVQICRALQAAHDAGVVHRDLKPGNVMLTERDGNPRFVKVLDFGVAKILDGEEITKTGAIVGTADYMAPELVKGEAIDGRADIYALGVLLYRLCTGTRIFPNSSSVPGYHNVYSDPEPPRQRAPGANIPPNLEAIILKCLAKEPEQRFPSMAATADALMALDLDDTGEMKALPALAAAFSDDGSPTSVTPLPSATRTMDTRGTSQAIRAAGLGLGTGVMAGVLALLFLVGAALLGWFLTQEEKPVAAAPAAPPVAALPAATKDSDKPEAPEVGEAPPAAPEVATAVAPEEPKETAAPPPEAKAEAEEEEPKPTRKAKAKSKRGRTSRKAKTRPAPEKAEDDAPRFRRVRSSSHRFERVHTGRGK